MKLANTVLFTALLGAPALATEGPQIRTLTNYGAFAKVAERTALDSLPQDTQIRNGLEVRARLEYHCRSAAASTRVTRKEDRRFGGHGVSIHEHANLQGGGRRSCAGTSASAPRSRDPQLDPHALELTYPVDPGSTGTVRIAFSGRATRGSSGSASIDVDGDGRPDFTAEVNTGPSTLDIPVTAGPNGVVITIITDGQALAGCRSAEYDFRVCVLFKPDSGHDCRFTPFGESCGLRLGARLIDVRGPEHVVRMNVSRGAPGAAGIILIGDQLATPIPLPTGSCNLLVDPDGIAVPITLGRCGQTVVDIPITLHCVIIGIQALTIDPRCGQMARASRGLLFTCCY